jgi:hypothetical protein
MFTRGYVLLILLDASILTLPVLSVVVLSDTSTILRTYHGCFLRPYGGFLKWGCPQIINFFYWISHYKPSSYWGFPIYPNFNATTFQFNGDRGSSITATSSSTSITMTTTSLTDWRAGVVGAACYLKSEDDVDIKLIDNHHYHYDDKINIINIDHQI